MEARHRGARDGSATPSRRPAEDLRILDGFVARATLTAACALTALIARMWTAIVTVPSAHRLEGTEVESTSQWPRRAVEGPAAEVTVRGDPSPEQQGHRGPPGLSLSSARDALLHELRVPLSAARFALERLDRMPARREDMVLAGDAVRTALLGIVEAQSIVRWFSQLRAVEREGFRLEIIPVSVEEVIQRALALLVGASQRFVVTVADDVRQVAADPVWLTQTFTNLFENAAKYARPSGVTRVEVTDTRADRVIVSVRTPGDPDSHLMRDVTSCSAGHRLRSDDLTSQGLGLKLVQFFVSSMGGDMWVESDEVGDTTFVLSLPVAIEHAGSPHRRRVRPMLCPQCGAETPEGEWNCVSCRVNLYWARRHYDELARIRQEQGLDARANTPPFLVNVSKRELNERAARGGLAMNKVRTIARRVMRGESSELP